LACVISVIALGILLGNAPLMTPVVVEVEELVVDEEEEETGVPVVSIR
jgi:hypothetical protein